MDAIVADYCQAGFGPAAENVMEYFRQLENMTTELANSSEYEGRKKNPEALAQCYTDEFLANCHALLDEADHKADDETVRQRIAFLRKALEYARIRRDWTLARAQVRQGDREAAQRVKDIEAERDAWYQKLGISWALNVAYLRFYGY